MEIKIGDRVKLTRGIVRHEEALSPYWKFDVHLRRSMSRKIWMVVEIWNGNWFENWIEVVEIAEPTSLHDQDDFGDPIRVESKYVKIF